VGENNTSKTTPSKKRKASSQSNRCSGTIAVGTDSGEIVVFDLKKNEVKCILSDKSKALGESVSDIAFNKNGSCIYSCSGSSNKVSTGHGTREKMRGKRWDLAIAPDFEH
jgi:hypothetical protein